jgi:hypothetical protein
MGEGTGKRALGNRHTIELGGSGVRIGKTCQESGVGECLQGLPDREISGGLHGKLQSRAAAELELEAAIGEKDGCAHESRRGVRVDYAYHRRELVAQPCPA